MSTKSRIILWVFILLVLAAGGFYLKGDILKIYNDFGKNLKKLEKTDLGDIVTEFKREVLAPAPLNVGGKETQTVLVKSKVIAETNIQRYNNGLLPPLVENTKLSQAALAKANDMFKNQYFEHISPSGIDPGTLVKNYGYDYIVTGENLILGNFKDEREVVQHWMDSPGHRANILNDRFTEIGVAIVKGKYNGKTVWIGVQEFGLPLSVCQQPELALKNQIDYNKNRLDNLIIQIDAKRIEIESTNPRSPKYNQLVDEYNQLVAQYNPLVQETKNLILQYNNQINIFNQCVTGQ